MPDGIRTKSMRTGGMRHSWAAFAKVGLFILIPTLIGIAIGMRLDAGGGSFWSVLLTLAGFVAGCLFAWRSVRVEMRHQGEGPQISGFP